MRSVYLLPLTASFLLLLTLGCGDSPPPTSVAVTSDLPLRDSLVMEPAPPPLVAGDELTAWVDGLFIRAAPETKAEILLQVSGGTPLTYTGKASDLGETIVLRGTAFRQPWLEVRTADGTEGWVFAGALQRPGEEKGPGYRGPEQFEFAHFGTYDLSEWQLKGTKATSGGDAENTIAVYTVGSSQLTIRQTDIGDYGYEREFTFGDTLGNVHKKREFRFQVNPELALFETVTDYLIVPTRQYRRTQAMEKHFQQLNARPEMADGPWEVRTPR